MSVKHIMLAAGAAAIMSGCAPVQSQPLDSTARLANIKPISCPADPSWSDPAHPRLIFGNSYYVGSCSVSAILITSPEGHILIDGVTKEAAPHINANIEALGFKMEDVRTILTSHEHHDHVGGVAYLQKASGAKVLTREPALAALRSGKSDRSDPQFDILDAFDPIANVAAVKDGDVTRVGPLSVTALAMPGHTPGGTGWTWTSCEGDICRNIVYADSISAISDKVYRYADHPEYVAAFRASLSRLKTVPCDILLTTHDGASNVMARLDGKAPLVASDACRIYAENGLKGLDARLAKEAAGEAP